jgi:hypothetical protein
MNEWDRWLLLPKCKDCGGPALLVGRFRHELCEDCAKDAADREADAL